MLIKHNNALDVIVEVLNTSLGAFKDDPIKLTINWWTAGYGAKLVFIGRDEISIKREDLGNWNTYLN